MSSKRFEAKDWFFSRPNLGQENSIAKNHDPKKSKIDQNINKINQINKKINTRLAPFYTRTKETAPQISNESIFNPLNHLIPGWSGESLVSKDNRKILIVLDNIRDDVEKCFNAVNDLPITIKENLKEEFNHFIIKNKFEIAVPESSGQFWQFIKSKEQNLSAMDAFVVKKFLNQYYKKITIFYFLKLRLGITIFQKLNLKIDKRMYFYTQSVLTNLFPQGGPREIKSISFESNIFSWYRPTEFLSEVLPTIENRLNQFSPTELFIIINKFLKSSYTQKTNEKNHSHAISHKTYGLFLNSLIINFPIWIEKSTDRIIRKNNPKKENEILSSLFSGDEIESLAQGYWLAQENNSHFKWDQYIVPDFKINIVKHDLFQRVCFDLQNITFLASIGNYQAKNLLNFLPEIVNGNYYNKKCDGIKQGNLLNSDIHAKCSTYDRVILNLINLPKNNPNHFLINKIQSATDVLKDNAFLFVLTNKKLFISSQKNKIIGILKNLKLESCINFEGVEGKGDIANYIYIFSKKDPYTSQEFNPFLNDKLHSSKENFFSFNLNGKLELFNEFEEFTDLLSQFIIDHITEAPPLYQTENENHKSLEFYQDTIVNGIILNSGTKDAGHITHPSYIKSLMKNYLYLGYFFDIEQINFEINQQELEFATFLSDTSINYTNSPFTLILDKRSNDYTDIEIISSSALEYKKEEYGITSCFYFGITAKWPNFDVYLLRDYFKSSIGQQLINLTFGQDLRKFKSNLEKLYIPKLFSLNKPIPNSHLADLEILMLEIGSLKEISPLQVQDLFNIAISKIYETSREYPKEVLTLLSNFKTKIDHLNDLYRNEALKNKNIFHNKFLLDRLKDLPLVNFYPNNEDVFIEFPSNFSNQYFALPLTEVKIASIKENPEVFTLEFYSNTRLIFKVFTKKTFAYFLQIIFNKATGISIQIIMQNLKIPKLAHLESLIEEFSKNMVIYKELSEQTNKSFQLILTKTISFS